ncbi:MAG: cytochrome c [Reichenbachiella sp.]
MKKNLNSIFAAAVFATFIFLLVGFTTTQEEWDVPEKYKIMKNPYAGDDEDGIGEELYMKHCKSCHGKEGYGDGTKANELETEMRELSDPDLQGQSDGSLFYKSIIGRDEMPNFEKKIVDEEDRWLIVNFIRTLEE